MPAHSRTRNLVLLPFLTLVVLLGLTVLGPVANADAASRERVSRAATVALQQLGDPYRYGSAGPRSFDCSGLMQYSYRKAGLNLPRTSSAQARRAHRISKSKLSRGDLMFFTSGGRVYHVAMFLKRTNGRVLMVHSPGSGKRVQRARAWTNSWFAGTLR